MPEPRILIAGLGDVFRGDGAFGVQVAWRMMGRTLPEGVRVRDAGTRGHELAMEILQHADAAILVDATPRGGTPGSLYLLKPGEAVADPGTAPDKESTSPLGPTALLRWIRGFGREIRHFYVVGCEPASLDLPDGRLALSPPVEAAVDDAIGMIENLVADIGAEMRREKAGHA